MSGFLERFERETGRRRAAVEIDEEVDQPSMIMGVGDVELPPDRYPDPAPPPAPVEDTPFLRQFSNMKAAEGAVGDLENVAAPVEDDPDELARLIELMPDYDMVPETDRAAYVERARAQVKSENEERAARRNQQQMLARGVFDVPSGPMPEGEVDDARGMVHRFAQDQRAALPAHAKTIDAGEEKLARHFESKRLGGAMQGPMRDEDAEGIIADATGSTALRAQRPVSGDVSAKGPELDAWRADQERIKQFQFDQVVKESEKVMAVRGQARASIGRFLNPYAPEKALEELDRKVELRAAAILGSARSLNSLSGGMSPDEEEEAKVNAYRRAFQEIASKSINDREESVEQQKSDQAKLDEEWTQMWGGSSLAPPGPKLPIDPLAETDQGAGAAAVQVGAEALRRSMWALSLPFIAAEDLANWVSKQRTGEGLIDAGLKNVGPLVGGINKVLSSPFIAAELIRERIKEKSPYLFDPTQVKPDDWFSPDTREALAEGGALAGGLLAAKGVHGVISGKGSPAPMRGPQAPWDVARERAQRQAMKEMGPTGAPEARKAEAAAVGRKVRAEGAARDGGTPADAPIAELGERLGEKGKVASDIESYERILRNTSEATKAELAQISAMRKIVDDLKRENAGDISKVENQIADLERQREAAIRRLPKEVRAAREGLEKAQERTRNVERDTTARREALADDIQRREAGPNFAQRARADAEGAFESPDAQFDRAIDSGTRERPRWQGMADEAYSQEGYSQERIRAQEEAEVSALKRAQERKEKRQKKLSEIAPPLMDNAGRDAEVARAVKIVNDKFDAELQQRAQERADLLASLGGREFNAVELGQERLWMRSFRERRARAIERAEDNARHAIHKLVSEWKKFEKEGNGLTKAEADAVRARVERTVGKPRRDSEIGASSAQLRERARGGTAENAPEIEAARAGAARLIGEYGKATVEGQRAGAPRKTDGTDKRATEKGWVRSPDEARPIGSEEFPLSPEEAAARVDQIRSGEPLIVPPGWRPPVDAIAIPDKGLESIIRQNAEDRVAADAKRAELAGQRVGPDLARAPDIAGTDISRVALPSAAEVKAFGTPGRPGVPSAEPSVTKFTPWSKKVGEGKSVTILGPDGKPAEVAKAPLKKPAPLEGTRIANERLDAVKAVLPKEVVSGFKSVGARLRKTGRVNEGNVSADVKTAPDGTYEYTVMADGKVKKSGRLASFGKAAEEATIATLEELAAQTKSPEKIEALAGAANAEAAPKADVKADVKPALHDKPKAPPETPKGVEESFTADLEKRAGGEPLSMNLDELSGIESRGYKLSDVAKGRSSAISALESEKRGEKFSHAPAKRLPAPLAAKEVRSAADMRRESLDEARAELEARKKSNPKGTEEEYDLGAHVEEIEPEVRGAVRAFNKKGAQTNSSGWYEGGLASAIDGWNLTEKQIEALEKSKLVELQRSYPDPTPVRAGDAFVAYFMTEGMTRAEIKARWDKVAEILPGSDKPAGPSGSWGSHLWRQENEPARYWSELISRDNIDRILDVPDKHREAVLRRLDARERTAARATLADPIYAGESNLSIVKVALSKLRERAPNSMSVGDAKATFDAAADRYVKESKETGKLPEGKDLITGTAYRLLAGESPIEVLRDVLKIEQKAKEARTPAPAAAEKKVDATTSAPEPVAERKVPAPMRKRAAPAPEAEAAKAAEFDKFAPDDLQTPFDGETGPISDSNGDKYRFSVERVDPKNIRGSFADEKGAKTKDFPEGFQARNFNAEEVKKISENFDPDKVGTGDTTPTAGSPVLWRDPRTGTYYTIAGNHRYLGGQIARYYADGIPRAFRVLQEPYGRAKRLAAFSQESPAAKMSLAERARALAVGYKLGVDHMPGALPAEPLDPSNVRKFLEKVENQRFTDRLFPEGIPPDKVAKETIFKVEAALLGLMPEGVRDVIETAKDATVEAIMAAAPALLAMKSKVVRGIARPEFDMLGYFERGARAYRSVEAKGMTSGQLAQHIRDLAETNDLPFEGASGKEVSPLSHLDPLDAGFLIALAKTETLKDAGSYFVDAIKRLDALSQENTPGQGGLFEVGGGMVEIPVASILEAAFGPQIAKQVARYIDVRARNGEAVRQIRFEDPEAALFGTGSDSIVASPAANRAVQAITEMNTPEAAKPRRAKKPKKGKGQPGDPERGAALHGGPLGMIFAAIGRGVDKLFEGPEYERRMPAAAQAQMGKLEGSRRPLPSAIGAVGGSVKAAYEGAREFADVYAEVRNEPGVGSATKDGRAIDLQVDLKDASHRLMNADELATESSMAIRNAVKNKESLTLAGRATIYRDLLRMVEENEELPRRKAYAQSEIQRIMAIRRGRLNGELTSSEKQTLEAAKATLREQEKALSGHTADGIRAILREVESELATRPDAQEAVRLTRAALDDAYADMKAMDPNFQGKRDYFPHHTIFEHTLDSPPATGSTSPVKRPFLRAKVHRGGTERPFDVDVAEVVYKHVRDIKRARVLHDFYESFRVSPNNLLPEVLRTGELPKGLTPADVSMWSFNRTPTKVGVPVELAVDRAAATSAVRGAMMSGVNPGEVLRQFNRGRVQPYVLVKNNVARALDGATEFAHVPADNIAMIATDMAHTIFRWTTLTARGGLDFIERNFGGDFKNLMEQIPGTSKEVMRAPFEVATKPVNFMVRSILEKIRRKEDPVLQRARMMNAYQSGLWGSALEARHRGAIERMATGKEGPREPWHTLSIPEKLARTAISVPMAPFSMIANLRVSLEAATRAQAVEALMREGYNLNAARVLGNQALVDYSLLSRNAKLTRRILAPYLAFMLQTSNNFLFPKVRSRATVWTRASLMMAMPMLYNWLVTPDMERELDPKMQASPHINIGRDAEGRVVSIDLTRFGMEPTTSAKVLAGIAGHLAAPFFGEDKSEAISRIARGALKRAGEDVRGVSGPGLTAAVALGFGKDIRTLDNLEGERDRKLPDRELEYQNFVRYGVPIANARLAKALSSFTGILRPPAKGVAAAPGVEKVVDATGLGKLYDRYEKQNPKAAEAAKRKFLGGGIAEPFKTSEPYERGIELREEEMTATLRAFADVLDRAREPGVDKAKVDAEKAKIIAKMKELRISVDAVRQFLRGRARELWKTGLSEDERKKQLNVKYGAPSAPEPRKE